MTRMHYHHILLFLFLAVCQLVHPQEVTDSLVRLMEKSKGINKIRLLNELSDAVLRQSPDQSIIFARQAFELASQENRENEKAVALNNLGKACYIKGDYARAENYYLEAVAVAEAVGDILNSSKCFNNLGVLYRSQGNFDKAIEFYNKALETSGTLNDMPSRARFLNNIGEIYKFRGDYSNAMLNYQESYQIKKDLGDREGMANTLNNLGEIFNYWGDYQKSLQYYQESSTLRTELGDKPGMATSLFNIGLIYKELYNNEQALKYFGEALKINEEIGENSGMAFCLDKIGEIYLDRKQYDMANEYFNRALSIQEELGNIQGKANSLKNLASVLYRKGDYGRSIRMLNQALAIYTDIRDQMGISDIYIRLGETSLKSDQVARAIECFNKSLGISLPMNHLQAVQQGYSGLRDAYLREENYEQALHYYNLFVQIKDSISNEAIRKNIHELETRYQTEKKEKEIELKNAQLARQEAEIRQKNLQQYGLIAGILLVITTALALYRGYRNKQKANLILRRQKTEIERKNLEITDSIRYAKHIQNAILPGISYVRSALPDAFIFYRPKAIVSGDFYWVEKVDRSVFVAAVDSTGHGVPGAFISLLGFNILNSALTEYKNPSPAGILDYLNHTFSMRLSKSHPDEPVRDSMEIALCKITMDELILEYAGAYNPLWLIRDGQLFETKGDKFPIGTWLKNPDRTYTNNVFKLRKGDHIYLFSDGYADQFGGSEGKKFRYTRMRDLLLRVQNKSMEEQSAALDQTLNSWMGGEEQIDDILVIGIRI